MNRPSMKRRPAGRDAVVRRVSRQVSAKAEPNAAVTVAAVAAVTHHLQARAGGVRAPRSGRPNGIVTSRPISGLARPDIQGGRLLPLMATTTSTGSKSRRRFERVGTRASSNSSALSRRFRSQVPEAPQSRRKVGWNRGIAGGSAGGTLLPKDRRVFACPGWHPCRVCAILPAGSNPTSPAVGGGGYARR